MTPRRLKALYEQGANVSALLRAEKASRHNDEEIIEIAYDLQSGSYAALMRDPDMAGFQAAYAAEIAATVRARCRPASILEAGVGEATTLSGVLESLGPESLRGYGFDLSWSRLACARDWLGERRLAGVSLCVGSLFHVPLATSSIDVVFTSHSIEPNGGAEEPILRELYRVARRYLILLEPAYEQAGKEARQRMEAHGYCRGLESTARRLGFEVVEHKLFPLIENPLNPTALTVIAKNAGGTAPANPIACPRYKTPLEEIGGLLYSPEAMVVYPVVAGIPCLRIENGIVASGYPERYAEGTEVRRRKAS